LIEVNQKELLKMSLEMQLNFHILRMFHYLVDKNINNNYEYKKLYLIDLINMMDSKDQFFYHQSLTVHLVNLESYENHKHDNNIDTSIAKITKQ
jgi:hypothetical protein